MKQLALAMLLVGAAAAHAGVLYSTDFEGLSLGTLRGQDSWLTDENPFNTDADIYQITSGIASSGTQALRFDTSRANFGNNWAFRELDWVPGSKKQLVVTVDVYAGSGSTPYSGFGIDATTNLPSVGARVAAVRVASNGQVYMVEQNGVRTFSANSVSTDAWHTLRLVMDFNTYVASSFVDGVDTGVTVPILAISVASGDLSAFAAGSQTGYFDNYKVEEFNKILCGTAEFKNYTASIANQPITFEVVDGSNAVVESGSTTVDAAGRFYIDSSVANGNYTLRIKGTHWLSNVATFTMGTSGATAPLISMENGDVDGDNVVSVFDYINLSDAFDSVDGDPNWLAAADLDGDGVVSVFDYIALSDNFDLTGL